MFKKYRHIHLVGIGGIGMSGIAEVLTNLGYQVSGSDLRPSSTTQRLKKRGVKIYLGHRAQHIEGAHVVVFSSAVGGENAELRAARQKGVPIVPRAEMLAELMRLKYSIAVAGTHGKTTITSLISWIMAQTGLDPTTIIGGKVNSWRTNARLGRGDFFVAEADESDRSFLKLTPTIAVISNIDREHMESYSDFAEVKKIYTLFANKVPFYGSVIACYDHPEVRRLIKTIERRVVTYGTSAGADYRATDIKYAPGGLRFKVYFRGEAGGGLHLNMVGKYNVVNALAAVAVARELEIPFSKIRTGLKSFAGIERRFQVLSKGPGPLVVTDYAHHPVEIREVLTAIRQAWPGRRLIAIMQPHRYSRLKDLFADFVKVLSKGIDILNILPVFAASEQPLRGISSEKLGRAVNRHNPRLPVLVLPTKQKLFQTLEGLITAEDLIIFLGAGDIYQIGKEFALKLKRKRR